MTVKFIFNDADSSALDGDEVEILHKLSMELGRDVAVVLMTLHHTLQERGEYRNGRLLCELDRNSFRQQFHFLSPKTLRYCLLTLQNRKLLYLKESGDKVSYRLMYEAIKELIRRAKD